MSAENSPEPRSNTNNTSLRGFFELKTGAAGGWLLPLPADPPSSGNWLFLCTSLTLSSLAGPATRPLGKKKENGPPELLQADVTVQSGTTPAHNATLRPRKWLLN